MDATSPSDLHARHHTALNDQTADITHRSPLVLTLFNLKQVTTVIVISEQSD